MVVFRISLSLRSLSTSFLSLACFGRGVPFLVQLSKLTNETVKRKSRVVTADWGGFFGRTQCAMGLILPSRNGRLVPLYLPSCPGKPDQING